MPKEILIVDDDPDILEVLYMTLESNGFSVKKANDGLLALESIKDVRPDLIISDIMMPRMNGFVLCEKIKNDQDLRSIPIILLTSRDEESNKFFNDFVQPDVCLHKPFDPDELIEVVKKFIM